MLSGKKYIKIYLKWSNRDKNADMREALVGDVYASPVYSLGSVLLSDLNPLPFSYHFNEVQTETDAISRFRARRNSTAASVQSVV